MEGLRSKEIQTLSVGDPFDEFYKRYGEMKDFHRRYPNEPVENLERAYKRRAPGEGESTTADIDNLFSGEEAFGKYFDLTASHEEYLNLPNVKHLSYLQYLNLFDKFQPPQLPLKKAEKDNNRYFNYVGNLANYLQSFIRRTRPLEDLDKLFNSIESDFEKAWSEDSLPGWSVADKLEMKSLVIEGTGEGIWCSDCLKEFKNDNVYRAHLTGKKHINNAKAKHRNGETNGMTNGDNQTPSVQRLKDRATASREYTIQRLAAAMETIREDTRVNVERKQGMTDRERQQELDALFADSADPAGPAAAADSDAESDEDEKIYNPLKLPLAWDGKPIPYWLYKLHGLGVEYTCEICGNFVYMGRRAFDKHFSEARHVYGLKCLGITKELGLFREITKIDQAVALWEKLERDRKVKDKSTESDVQMEDAEGNVMPEKVYYEYVPHSLLCFSSILTAMLVYKSKVYFKSRLSGLNNSIPSLCQNGSTIPTRAITKGSTSGASTLPLETLS